MPEQPDLFQRRAARIFWARHGAATWGVEPSQRLQNPLIQEYTLNHIRVPIIVQGILLN